MKSLMTDSINSVELEFTDYSHSGMSRKTPQHGGFYEDDSSDGENYSEDIDRLFQTESKSRRHLHGGAMDDSDDYDYEFVDPDYLFTDEIQSQRGGGISSIERDFLGMYKKAEDYHHRLAEADSDEKRGHHANQTGGDGFSSEYDNFFMYGGKREMNPKVVKMQALTAMLKDPLTKKGVPYKKIQKISSYLYNDAAALIKSEDPETVFAKAKEMTKGNLDAYIKRALDAPEKAKKPKKNKKEL